ncbi:hypothetical protein OC844_008084, partial [Tilletia horrida]
MTNIFANNIEPVDLDSYNISLGPDDILQRFGPSLPVDLAAHFIKIRDLPGYDKMMTLGRSGFVWRIDPEYKKELLRCLANNFGLILLPAFSKFAF